MSHRPLAIVSALTLGDYVLWNWSLGANHEIVALASGLTLPPLGIVFVWLTVLSVGRLIARSALRSRSGAHRELDALRTAPERSRPAPSSLDTPAASDPAAGHRSRRSDKLAA